MDPDHEDGIAAHDLIEEIRVRCLADIIQLIAAVRELGRILEEEGAIELLMPERWKQTLFLRAIRDAKVDLWRALKNAELPKPPMVSPKHGIPFYGPPAKPDVKGPAQK